VPGFPVSRFPVSRFQRPPHAASERSGAELSANGAVRSRAAVRSRGVVNATDDADALRGRSHQARPTSRTATKRKPVRTTTNGVVAREDMRELPPPRNFWAVEKMSKNFWLAGKFEKNANFGTKTFSF